MLKQRSGHQHGALALVWLTMFDPTEELTIIMPVLRAAAYYPIGPEIRNAG